MIRREAHTSRQAFFHFPSATLHADFVTSGNDYAVQFYQQALAA